MSAIQSAATAEIAASIATILFGLVILIQLLIAAGILPITMAWGGRQAVLTPGLRMAGIASAIVLGLFAYVIRYRAGLTGAESISVWIEVFAWVITAFMVLNTFSNLASQSTIEKVVFVPITSILAIACFVVSISKQ